MKDRAIAFFDHIRACNNADLSRLRPFNAARTRLGWIGDDFAARLRDWPKVFSVTAQSVELSADLVDCDARSAALAPVLAALAAAGDIEGWRGEEYSVMANWKDAPLLKMERAACPHFGVRAWGVHMNGYVRRADGLYLWVATRARDKPTYPGFLDNMVSGGQPHGIGPLDNMIKECAEAGIPAGIAAGLQSVGALSYCHQSADGVKPDQIFCYDLELPADFTPVNQDGEIEKFELWPIQKVAGRVRDGLAFKFNCNLVIIDFLIRHGIVTPQNEPGYMALVQGLHRAD